MIDQLVSEFEALRGHTLTHAEKYVVARDLYLSVVMSKRSDRETALATLESEMTALYGE